MTTITIDETKRGAKNLIAYLRNLPFVEIQTEPINSITEEEFLDEMSKEKINYHFVFSN